MPHPVLFPSVCSTPGMFLRKRKKFAYVSIQCQGQLNQTHGVNNEEALVLEPGKIWGLESMFPFADALPLAV